MKENPFLVLDEKLDHIINMLVENESKQQPKLPIPVDPIKFKYMPIQEIFAKKICSKPTFYEHIRDGDFSLYKFGGKSFVDREEFMSAFRKINIIQLNNNEYGKK